MRSGKRRTGYFEEKPELCYSGFGGFCRYDSVGIPSRISGAVKGALKKLIEKGETYMSSENELNQTGFDAIAEAVQKLYPDQEGLYYGTVIPYVLGKAVMASLTGIILHTVLPSFTKKRAKIRR